MIADDPLAGQTVPPLMTDADWIGLQGICAGT